MSNTAVVELQDGRRVLLSYGVAVAAFIPADVQPNDDPNCRCPVCEANPHGYVTTDRKWSVTTSRHANAFCGSNATTVPDDVFVRLIEPVAAKGR